MGGRAAANLLLQAQPLPLPSVPLVLRPALLPNIRRCMTPIKGSNPTAKTSFSERSNELVRPLTPARGAQDLGAHQVELGQEMIAPRTFLASGARAPSRRIKNRLRDRADLDSSKESAACPAQR